jgi:transcription elongation GreA/GreB family factor
MNVLKSKLHEICLAHVNKRIFGYKDEIETIKESIESIDKSSDEDDDSGHGKLLNDLEKNAQHLNDASKMLEVIKSINPKTIHQNIVLGSVVKTDSSTFYIAVSIGKVELDNEAYFIISKFSPIGELLLNKTVGDTIIFNESRYNILEVK